jgi:hypothetical protein
MCWACSADSGIMRAHIQGDVKNGANEPSNFFLLCNACHAEQPDASRPDQQLSWLQMVRETGSRIEKVADGFKRLTGVEIKTWFDTLRERYGEDAPDQLIRRLSRENTRDRVSSYRMSNLVGALASEYEQDMLNQGQWPKGRPVLV